MDVNKLKHVVGQAQADKPAIIRFFDSVNEWSTNEFNEEFLWLQNVVKPSKIVVMINSEGGSVMYGMSTFSVIQGCPIEVDCVIEGIAASMGSVIWAAGDNLYMHDYSLLMIHNPFNCSVDDSDESTKQMVNAFRSQLETIYRKRFGMTKDQVKSIMDGEGEADGTFFTADDAVKAGFIEKDHIIKTSKQVREKVKNQIDSVEDSVEGRALLRGFMSSLSVEKYENKLLEDTLSIHNRKDNHNFQALKVMENENQTFETISAQLGFSKDEQVAKVSARIADLIKTEGSLKAAQEELTQLKIKLEGNQAELGNVKGELEKAKASLKKYQDAEAAAFEAQIDATIQAAVNEGKIEEASKASWVELAHANFNAVKETLASIQGRENIPEEIAKEPSNEAQVEATLQTVEEKTKEKVKEVCGEMKLQTF